jgi:hypothetical protein
MPYAQHKPALQTTCVLLHTSLPFRSVTPASRSAPGCLSLSTPPVSLHTSCPPVHTICVSLHTRLPSAHRPYHTLNYLPIANGGCECSTVGTCTHRKWQPDTKPEGRRPNLFCNFLCLAFYPLGADERLHSFRACTVGLRSLVRPRVHVQRANRGRQRDGQLQGARPRLPIQCNKFWVGRSLSLSSRSCSERSRVAMRPRGHC